MQHIAMHVDTVDEVLEMRDRLRSRGIQVVGALDHGFIQSIYFEGPEGLNLEVCCGSDIDERAWIDPEVVGLCGINAAELDAMKSPSRYDRPGNPVAQPTEAHPTNERARHAPERYAALAAMPDDVVWDKLSETTPPVDVG